jgi:hypothetical protein
MLYMYSGTFPKNQIPRWCPTRSCPTLVEHVTSLFSHTNVSKDSSAVLAGLVVVHLVGVWLGQVGEGPNSPPGLTHMHKVNM